jgi:hypothetical protein
MSARWESDTSTTPTTFYARILVGPGGSVELAEGLWSCWVKVSDSPEALVRNAGYLRVV